GHAVLQRKCPLFDPKRTSVPLSVCWLKPVRCPVLSLGGGNETARVHFICWWRSDFVATRGAGAAGRAHAAHRSALRFGRERSGSRGPPRGVPAGAAAIGLDRRS